jgi:hypothetical protein
MNPAELLFNRSAKVIQLEEENSVRIRKNIGEEYEYGNSDGIYAGQQYCRCSKVFYSSRCWVLFRMNQIG